jgi:hypothetical protein
MAASGDLGMSLGGEPGAGAYLRLWRHHADTGWQLAVEVGTPVLAAPAGGGEPGSDGAEASGSDGAEASGSDPGATAEPEEGAEGG